MSMTAKRKKGPLLARLEDLEAKEAARLEDVRAQNWGQIQRAVSALRPADRAALEDVGVWEGEGPDPDTLARISQAVAHLPEGLGLEGQHAAKEEAEQWAEAWAEVPDGVPLARPPAGRVEDFAAYFEAEALTYDREARRVPLSADVHRLARWCAALSRFTAALCRVLGGPA